VNSQHDNRGFISALIGDGRSLISFVGLMLVLFGAFALFLALTRQFLPHDLQYLGMSAEELCAHRGCRIVHFMMHDRAAFGGTLVAVGLLYLWLAEFPLRHGEAWAWWLLLVNGAAGFASFLLYLGHGYLDSWHGVGTLILLPCFIAGIYLSRRRLKTERAIRSLFTGDLWGECGSRQRIGQACLLGTGIGMCGAGLLISTLGMTAVFVPQDLAYMGIVPSDLEALNLRLIPLIAHDRAGFGGALFCAGLLVVGVVWHGPPTRALRQALALAGLAAFGPAIAVHFVVGYENLLHVAPALGGAGLYVLGVTLMRPANRKIEVRGGCCN
jgi:hypothetical protein